MATNSSNPTIRFKAQHRSLTAFPELALPKFVVLTGVNGAGKTHLLQALDTGALEVEGIPDKQIRYFDWTSLFTVEDRAATRDDIRKHGARVLEVIKHYRSIRESELRQALAKHGVDAGAEPWEYLRSQPNLRAAPEILTVLQRFAGDMFNNLGWDALRVGEHLVRDGHDPLGFAYLDGHELEFSHLQQRLSNDAFGLGSVSSVVMAYFELELFNRLARLDRDQGHEPEIAPLDDEEFRRRYGPPPCDVINDILVRLGLDFFIEGPRRYTTTSYQAVLRRRSEGAEVPLSQLSSGEKMIMALALCTYSSESRVGQQPTVTRLALFDEIDAPLHPSMVKTMLSVIEDVIIRQLGCRVILATHSATTVALAPEDSIYTMSPGQPGLRPQSRQDAIALLTAELPTLCLDYSGRRQVLVESDNDARRYTELYEICRPWLNSDRSLCFIGVGGKSPKGDVATGCDIVCKLTQAMVEHGNQSVFGLIDWDGKNKPASRVMVVAHGRRYAIENCLLDPLLLLGMIRYHLPDVSTTDLGFKPAESIAELRQHQPERLQALADKVQALVLRQDGGGEVVEVRYRDGGCLNVQRAYLERQGHDLESAIMRVFGAFGTKADLLDKAIRLLREHRGWVPLEIVEVFESLLG
jgi:ABC-type transport system involved in cytochrome c biogenesis ATPase subunit